MTSTSDAALVEHLKTLRQIVQDGAWKAMLAQAAARIEALSKVEGELAKLRQAIADKGGSEHAPTQWAYDKACEALHKSGDREASLRAQLDAICAEQKPAIFWRLQKDPQGVWHEGEVPKECRWEDTEEWHIRRAAFQKDTTHDQG